MPSRHPSQWVAAFFAMAGALFAAGSPPDTLTLQDLVNRPDRWPAAVTVPRDFNFGNGVVVHTGDKARVVQFDGSKVLLIAGKIRFTATPADSGLLASANEAWAALTPAQRAIDPDSLAADPSLWPSRVKTTSEIDCGYGKLPPGTEVGVYTISARGPDIVWPNSNNRINVPFSCADVFDRARTLALADRGDRPSRIAAALQGIMVDSDGKAYSDPHLGEKKLFALYFGASWCAPCHEFSPDLVRYMDSALPKHPELAAVFLSDDKQVDPMLAYMKEVGMPFPAVPPAALDQSAVLRSFASRMIPQLVIVDRSGKVLATSDDNQGNRIDPKDTIGALDQLLVGQAR